MNTYTLFFVPKSFAPNRVITRCCERLNFASIDKIHLIITFNKKHLSISGIFAVEPTTGVFHIKDILDNVGYAVDCKFGSKRLCFQKQFSLNIPILFNFNIFIHIKLQYSARMAIT